MIMMLSEEYQDLCKLHLHDLPYYGRDKELEILQVSKLRLVSDRDGGVRVCAVCLVCLLGWLAGCGLIQNRHPNVFPFPDGTIIWSFL